jgi:CDP-paratose 2-epimerase
MSGRMASLGGPVLVTGGAGFIGSNLSHRLATLGHDVIIFDALLRPGVEANLAWLTQQHGRKIRHLKADVRDGDAVGKAVAEASAIFHFAAQVAVTTSLSDPRSDFDVNAGGTFSILDAVRRREQPIPVIFASTNKVYGSLSDIALRVREEAYEPVNQDIRKHGISEARNLDFHTPYGCSKGTADQYVLDFARSFGVPSAVLRMSCIYGPRQRGTEDQGWVAHFMIRALEGKPISLYGDGFQVRDVLDVDNCVDAYLACLDGIDGIAGQAFNLGGGPENAVSLRQLLAEIEAIMGEPVETQRFPWRPGDQRYYVSDIRKIGTSVGLAAPTHWRKGLRRLASWLQDERGLRFARLEAAE